MIYAKGCHRCANHVYVPIKDLTFTTYDEVAVWVFNSKASAEFYQRRALGCRGCSSMYQERVLVLALFLAKLGVKV